MNIVVGVKNFGKISKAEISLQDLVIFVGNNNSGKTMIMQLIYGVLDYLCDTPVTIDGYIEKITENLYDVDSEWYAQLEKEWNEELELNKKDIVSDIFKREINIEELYIRIENIEGKYSIERKELLKPLSIDDSQAEEILITSDKIIQYSILYEINGEIKSLLTINTVDTDNIEDKVMVSLLSEQLQRIILLCGKTSVLKQIFFPASRTGIQLLYKYFFSGRDKKLTNKLVFGNEVNDSNIYGLTEPVYEYLQFLQNYAGNIRSEEANKELLQFVEEHVLDGKITMDSDEVFYQEFNSQEKVPMYLASAMINEMTPIVKALRNVTRFDRYYWDEIETCIHPLKQGELARFIVRAVNSGIKMIVSTHSDTMAGKLNNLIVLSKADSIDSRNAKLDKLNLEEKDMLKDKEVKIYQFINDTNGKSHVDEIKYRTEPNVGYDFKLFMQGLDELYRETEIVME